MTDIKTAFMILLYKGLYYIKHIPLSMVFSLSVHNNISRGKTVFAKKHFQKQPEKKEKRKKYIYIYYYTKI